MVECTPRDLEIRSVSVSFGGVLALDRVDLDVGAHEIVGLIGPNGAGKSTLVNCVGGQLMPESGSISLAGQALNGLEPYRRARIGVGRTFQRLALFPELTVREHLFVALRAQQGRRSRLLSLVDRAQPSPEESRQINQTLAAVGLGAVADETVATLPLGTCRLVEVARALVARPCVLLADEPSSGLDGRETVALSDVLRSLPAQGVGVLLVEHHLSLVSALCDRVAVLHVGRVITEGRYEVVMADPMVRQAYLGEVV